MICSGKVPFVTWNWKQAVRWNISNGRSLPWAAWEWFKYENKLGDQIIKQLLNSVIAKYCDLSVSRWMKYWPHSSVPQLIDLLATAKSQYFAQPACNPTIDSCKWLNVWIIFYISITLIYNCLGNIIYGICTEFVIFTKFWHKNENSFTWSSIKMTK